MLKVKGERVQSDYEQMMRLACPVFMEIMLRALLGNVDQLMLSNCNSGSSGGECKPNHECDDLGIECSLCGFYDSDRTVYWCRKKERTGLYLHDGCGN